MREEQSDYTKNDLEKYLGEDTKNRKLAWLYREYYVKKTRTVKDNNISICDYIAKKLLELDDNLEYYFIKNIPEIYRKPRTQDKGSAYIPKGHNIKIEKEKANVEKKKALSQNKPLGEVWLAKTLLDEELDYIGKIINFQIPIDDSDDNSVGKVDLLAYNKNYFKDKKIISLIEFKRNDNSEAILRAILEICTYYCRINKELLVKEYAKSTLSKTEVWKVVLIYKDSKQHKDFIKFENIRTLVRKLNVKIFLLDNNNTITPLAL